MSGFIVLSIFGELFADMMLALKIFALLAVVSFVYSHLGKGPLAYALIGGVSWFVLFDYWKFFGGVFVLYTLLTLGISGILIDFFFVSGMTGGEEARPVDNAMDLMMRQKQLEKAKKMQAKGGSGKPSGKMHLGPQAKASGPKRAGR